MKKLLILILAMATFSSCSNDDDISDQITGKWKLLEVRSYGFGGKTSIDYSDENIIYNFQSNGILVITGGENVDYWNGEYDYFFGEDHLGGDSDPKVLLVKIDGSKWTYNLTKGKMTLGQSYVDGPDLVFERL